MSLQIPKLLFIGAGNIAQSIMRGIIQARPSAAEQILATAPTSRNLDIIKSTLGCRTVLLNDASSCFRDFEPDFVLLCVKPQVLMNSISCDIQPGDMLSQLLKSTPLNCTTLSLLAGTKRDVFTSALNLPVNSVVRVMLNTAAEIGSTCVVYNAPKEMSPHKIVQMEELFKLIGEAVIGVNDENLMDVATGICGSGIAFFYEMVQTISDIGVYNGFGRSDATLIAAQLSKSAGEMLLKKRVHPYQLRDEVTSPAGTTIYGLSAWHERSIGPKIGEAIQASINRATSLCSTTKAKLSETK